MWEIDAWASGKEENVMNAPSILHNFPTNLNQKKSKSPEFGLMIYSGTI